MADTGAAILAATQGFNAFSQFLPRLSEIRRADPKSDPDMAADVRIGEVAAVGVTVGTGAIITSLTKSNTPIVIAVIVSLGFIFLYESTLRGTRPLEGIVVSEHLEAA